MKQKKILWISDYGMMQKEINGLKQFFGMEVEIERLAIKDSRNIDNVLSKAEDCDAFAFGSGMLKAVAKGLFLEDTKKRPIFHSKVSEALVVTPTMNLKVEVGVEREFKCWKLIVDANLKEENLF